MGKTKLTLKDFIIEALPDMYISSGDDKYTAYIDDVKTGALGYIHNHHSNYLIPIIAYVQEESDYDFTKFSDILYESKFFNSDGCEVNVYMRERNGIYIEDQETFPYIPYNENDEFFKNIPKDLYYKYIESETEFSTNMEKTINGNYSDGRNIFSLYSLHTPETKKLKKLFDENIDKVRIVTNGIIWPLFSVKVFISERTENIEIIVPNKRSEFKDLSKMELLEWAFDNCKIVPIKIRGEEFYNSKVSHKWSHIKKDGEMMKKLREYLSIIDRKPTLSAYYYIKCIKRKNKMIWYLKRDLKMSPFPE